MSGSIAVNDQTGEVVLFRNGQWRPARTATGPEGQRMYQEGDRWHMVPSADVQPATTGSSIATGAGDQVHGGAQFLANAAGAAERAMAENPRLRAAARVAGGAFAPLAGVTGLVTNPLSTVNNAATALNNLPGIGPVTRALGMTPSSPEQINARVAQREADYQDSRRQAAPPGQEPGTDWARIGGNVAAGLPVAVATGGVPATLRGAAGMGAAQGAAMGAATPVGDMNDPYWQNVRTNAATGAAAGAAGGAAAYGLGRAMTGAVNASPEVRTLAAEGVQMTPGQIAGGAARTAEDALGSLPIVGDQIRTAQRAGVESFNRSVANRVLAPLGQRVPDSAAAGRSLVDDVYQRISSAYEAVVPRVQPFAPDRQFAADIQRASSAFMTPDAQRAFVQGMRDRVMSRLQASGGRLNGQDFQAIDQELGQIARRYSVSQAPADQELGAAARGVQEAFRDLLARTNPPLARDLRAANAAFARYVRMERAAGAQGATDGVFSPQQFSGAVRGADNSVRHGAYARGDALMQDLSDAGRAVLPSTVPDSGTARRLLTPALLAGGGASGMINPGIAAAGAGAYGAYTSPAQQMIQSLMLGQRPAGVTVAGNALAALGAPLGVGAVNAGHPRRP